MLGKRQGVHQVGYLGNRFHLFHIQLIHLCDTQSFQESIPVDARNLLPQFGVGHLVIVGFRITQFRSAARNLGNGCFNFHYIVHLLRSFGFRASYQCEKLRDVFLILFTDIRSYAVGIEVIFLFTQVDTSLTHLEDVQAAVLRVGIYIAAEIGTDSLHAELGHHRDDFTLVLQGSNLFQLCLDRFIPLLVQCYTIHGHVVEVTDFLSGSSGFALLGSQSFYQFTNLFLVVLGQQVESTETGIFSSQRMLFVPSATSILEKVLTGRYGSIHVGQVKA